MSSSPKRVLILAPQPFFTIRGTPINVRALASVLGEAGFDVDLLVFPAGNDITIPGVRIIRCANPLGIKKVPIGPSWRKLVLDTSLFAKAVALSFRNRYALVHGIEEGGIFAWFIAKLHRIPFIYDVDSDIPFELKQKRFWNFPPFVFSVKELERACVSSASAVITVCPALTDKVRTITPDGPVYEIADFPLESSSTSDSVLCDEILRKLRPAGRKIILYTGNFQDYQGIPLLIRSFHRLRSEAAGTNSVLVILGGGHEEAAELRACEELVRTLSLGDHVVFVGRKPIEEIGSYLSIADVLVSPRSSGVNTPLKIYSYMQAQRPIVATNITAHTQVLDDSLAFLADPEPQAFAHALRAALDDSELGRSHRERMVKRASALAWSRYSESLFRARVQGTYFSILGVPSGLSVPSGGHTFPAGKTLEPRAVPARSKVLVTGAAGFVGSHMMRYLKERGIAARGLVRTEEQAVALRAEGYDAAVGDIRDRSAIEHAFEGIHEVFHIASLFRRSGPDSEFTAANVQGTRNVFEAAIAAGAHRVVHCSTVGVHGDVEAPPADEHAPYNPGDIYQRTKMEGELLALDFLRSGRIGGVVIRPAMIYGPGDRRTKKLFKKVAERSFFYVGKGDALVHFVDVRDLVHGFYLAMQRRDRNAEVYIIAGREAMPLRQVVGIIADYFDVKHPWLRLPVKPMQLAGSCCEKLCMPFGIEPPIFRRRVDFFTKNRHFSASKAERELGFYPERTLREEIRDICDWYVEHGQICPPKRGKKRATIVRDLHGNIIFWDVNAERSYGWKPEQAIGEISHSLLQTEFPDALARINEQLMRTKLWEGELVHTTKEGMKIRVSSRWECVEQGDEGVRVVETNEKLDQHTPHKGLRERIGAAAMVMSDWMGILPEFLPFACRIS